jgi:hypothetical protein
MLERGFGIILFMTLTLKFKRKPGTDAIVAVIAVIGVTVITSRTCHVSPVPAKLSW